jgi:hypothetical protein
MLVQYHVLSGFIVSFFLYPVYGLNAVIIFLSSILIDIDHAAYYIFKFKSFNLKRASNYFVNEEETHLLFFHTAEFLVILLLLSFYSDFMFFALIGVAIHFVLDLRDELRFSYIGRFPSLIWHLIRNRNKTKLKNKR